MKTTAAAATTYTDERGHEHAACALCGVDCSTHPDAGNPLASCGDCGRPTCPDHRVHDSASRCNDCAATHYTTTHNRGQKDTMKAKTTKTTTAKFEIVKNGPREAERETRTGRIVRSMITTWDVVEVAKCRLVSDHHTRREAVAALARLNAKSDECPQCSTIGGGPLCKWHAPCAQCCRPADERRADDKQLIDGLCGACREANAEMQADDAAVAAHRVAPAYTPKNSHDEENPAYLFSGTSTAILCGVLNGTIDPLRLVRVELANRGLNRAGVWVGFEQAKRLAEVGR